MSQVDTEGSPNRRSLKHRALDKTIVKGMAWTAAAQWGVQVVTWGCTLVVARLLTPGDYGLVGMATVFLGLVRLFSEFGIGDAVVAIRQLGRTELYQLHTTSLVLGILGFLITGAVAYPLGIFFHAPKLPLLILVSGIGFPIIGFRTVPYALLRKEMKFKTLALLQAIQTVAQAVSILLLALFGFAYWALVIGPLIAMTITAILPLVYEPMRLALPRWRSIEAELKFSSNVISSRLCYYGYDSADMWIVGRVLGQASLGAYSLAYSLAHAPAEKLAAITNRVTLSLFSAVGTDLASVRRYLRNLTQGIALIILPAGIGMALVAPEFTHLILGRKWDNAIVPLQLLTLYASFRAVRTPLSPLLNALGAPHLVRRNDFRTLLVLPPCFYIGSHWGITGVAACWVVIYPAMTLLLLQDALRKIQMHNTEYARAIWPGLSSCIPMAATVLLLKRAFPHDLPLSLQLATEILGGGGAYCLTLLTIHRQRLLAFFQLRKLLTEAG